MGAGSWCHRLQGAACQWEHDEKEAEHGGPKPGGLAKAAIQLF